MSRMMIQAAVTMNQLQSKLDLIGHNMANSQTTGYKTRQAEFSSLLFQQINNLNSPENAEGRLTPDGIRIGSGARLGATNINLEHGSLVTTNRALDTALVGENQFFQVQVIENGNTETRYTRDGSFYLNPINNNQDVMLVSSDGNPILGENGPIVIPEGFDAITIRENGQIVTQRGGQEEIAGSIAVVEVVRPRLLESTGQNMFRLPNTAELGLNFGDIIQNTAPNENILQSGTLEQSNVDVAEQMSDLIMAQRSYQFNARTISMGDQMMGLVNQLRS
ncbi:flagellar hook-basal body complex protein [Oceanobacillus sp. 143]|uniref:Flagellar hook-basal body protein n=1 Tax=Oceanobacillus zhaokaii TaxID=2052660 RepID=A0A345PKS3_9BACI|nr:flagellar hook-basal body protein [Oceanobacillus zhaokaii]AXI10603.1 flagellar hook-basal body protein [Oceanobacillus zhaokaii]QGS69595.1 flagellar hook-basal body complex protein [Oceanobacillus sp. 143]